MSLSSPHQSQTGFTLIELLVVVSLTVMLMLTASAVMMTFLISSAKTSSIKLVKQEGDYAAGQIELLLRNAVELVPNSFGQTCAPDMSEISVKAYDNSITTLSRELEGPTGEEMAKIASNSGTFLTSDAVNLVDPNELPSLNNNPNFDCQTSADGLTNYVTTTFVVRKGVPGVDAPVEIVEETFSIGVNVRSY